MGEAREKKSALFCARQWSGHRRREGSEEGSEVCSYLSVVKEVIDDKR